jgi:ABC-type ATPase with predicted acetyltransferase domain
VDEFTSVVDRQVAKVASHTVQKAVRRQSRQLVAVTRRPKSPSAVQRRAPAPQRGLQPDEEQYLNAQVTVHD